MHAKPRILRGFCFVDNPNSANHPVYTENMLDHLRLKRVVLIVAIFILALIAVYGLLILNSTIFPGGYTHENNGNPDTTQTSSLTPEQETQLIEATTATNNTTLTQKEQKALMDGTSVPSRPVSN
jgi:hypothetical protein